MHTTKLAENTRFSHYVIEEAIKTVRTNLLFCSAGKKTILFTSCQANEGKTTIAVELARSLVQAGKKILVIDADLRKFTMMRRYCTDPGALGLSQYLSGQASYDDVLYHTDVENLDIIFAGQCPPNPAELMGSPLFKELLDSQRDNYDYIFLDTPPVGMVIDAAVCATICDGAVMIVSVGSISAKFANSAKEQLTRSGCPVIGAILNDPGQKKKSKSKASK